MREAAIYPGTFDPVTMGHMDVIRRAAQIFDRLVVAVVESPHKKLWFDLDERLEMVTEAVRDIENVEVTAFDGLLVEFAREQEIQVLVRGLRAFSDFEYEFQMALSNRKLAPDIETLFLMTSESYSYVSSSIVREIVELGGNVAEFVPKGVLKALESRQQRPAR